MAEEQQPSGLFAIFLLTIYSLVLIPYTLYRLCSSGDVKAQAVVKVCSGAARCPSAACWLLAALVKSSSEQGHST